MKTWFVLLICLVGTTTLSAQKKPAVAVKPKAFEPTIVELLADYRFDEASSRIQKEITAAQKKKLLVAELQAQQAMARLGVDMLRATKRVVFIDSVVLPKSRVLEALRLTPESGQIAPYSLFFPNEQTTAGGAPAFCNQLGDRVYFPQPDATGRLRLCVRYKLGDTWSESMPLAGLEQSGEQQQAPFVLSDGVTVYYAAESNESLGGLDIFVTRYNAVTKQFLKPENIGMPFNSQANDYLYVIDEQTQLGWFVTDRRQSADSVCVYTFLPTEVREIYPYSESVAERVRHLARITCISDTQTDKAAVAHARERLLGKNQFATTTGTEKQQFCFIVNNEKEYTRLTDFRYKESQAAAQTWLKLCADRDALLLNIDALRQQYAHAASAVKSGLGLQIRAQEQQAEGLAADIHQIEKQIRRLENGDN